MGETRRPRARPGRDRSGARAETTRTAGGERARAARSLADGRRCNAVMADKLVAMGFGLVEAENALAQVDGNVAQASALLLAQGEDGGVPPQNDQDQANLATCYSTVGGRLPKPVLGELWVLDLDAHTLRAYLTQNGVAMPENTPFIELQRVAVDLVARLESPSQAAAEASELQPQPVPEPEPAGESEGIPPSVVDAVPQVLAVRRAESWPSCGPVRLDLKALAREMPKASDDVCKDVAWAQLLHTRETIASEISTQPALLTMLISALHIIDCQERKLEQSVAGVAEEAERSESALRMERDLRLAREHSVERARSEARRANAKMVRGETKARAQVAKTQQEKQAAEQKAAANAAAAERKQRKAEKALAAEK
eukprot:COSAG02_NODE_6969_length_3258_cov_5.714924_1_plen_370_part_10